jgi:hypothetical protein
MIEGVRAPNAHLQDQGNSSQQNTWNNKFKLKTST